MRTASGVNAEEATTNNDGCHAMDGTMKATGVSNGDVTPGEEFTEDAPHGGPTEAVEEVPLSMRKRRKCCRRRRYCKHVVDPDGVPADATWSQDRGIQLGVRVEVVSSCRELAETVEDGGVEVDNPDGDTMDALWPCEVDADVESADKAVARQWDYEGKPAYAVDDNDLGWDDDASDGDGDSLGVCVDSNVRCSPPPPSTHPPYTYV